MIFYLLAASPFTNKITEKSLLLGELCILSFYVIFSLPYASGIEMSPSKQSHICLFIVLVNLLSQAAINILSSVVAIYNWIKKRKMNKIENLFTSHIDNYRGEPEVIHNVWKGNKLTPKS